MLVPRVAVRCHLKRHIPDNDGFIYGMFDTVPSTSRVQLQEPGPPTTNVQPFFDNGALVC